jgi:hypothetical protein
MIRTTYSTLLSRAAALTFTLAAVGVAQAAPIVHGNRIGTTVDYIGIQEESGTDPIQGSAPGPGLFGAPTIGGDTLDFNPQNFVAATTAAGGSDQTDSNLQFMIVAHPGKSIQSIFFTESGDTGLSGFTGDAATEVDAFFNVEIAEVNGVPVSFNVPQQQMIFAPNGGAYQLSVVGGPIFNSGWNGSILVDLGPTIALNGITGRVTKVNVSIDNRLTAASSAGASAFIQKKDADGLIITTNVVPEPASAAIALLAVALGGSLARRRR